MDAAGEAAEGTLTETEPQPKTTILVVQHFSPLGPYTAL